MKEVKCLRPELMLAQVRARQPGECAEAAPDQGLPPTGPDEARVRPLRQQYLLKPASSPQPRRQTAHQSQDRELCAKALRTTSLVTAAETQHGRREAYPWSVKRRSLQQGV